MNRRLLGGVTWVIVGLVLGVAAGYFSSPGGIAAIVGLLPLAVGVLGFAGLLLVAAKRRSLDPLLAAVAMACAGVVGVLLAPDAPGARQVSKGTGWAGTAADHDALWTGALTCVWIKGQRMFDHVDGFDVAITDPAVLAARGLRSATIWALTFPPPDGWSGGGPDRYSLLVDMLSEREPGRDWPGGFMAAIDETALTGRTGTALVEEVGIVLGWSCADGP